MVGLVNFAELGFEFDDEPIENLNDDQREAFRRSLSHVLIFFANGKMLRQQPKSYYTPNLRLRGSDEPSYQLTSFGKKLLASKSYRRSCIFFALAWVRARQAHGIHSDTQAAEMLTRRIADITDAKGQLDHEGPAAPSGWIYRQAKRDIERGMACYSVDKE